MSKIDEWYKNVIEFNRIAGKTKENADVEQCWKLCEEEEKEWMKEFCDLFVVYSFYDYVTGEGMLTAWIKFFETLSDEAQMKFSKTMEATLQSNMSKFSDFDPEKVGAYDSFCDVLEIGSRYKDVAWENIDGKVVWKDSNGKVLKGINYVTAEDILGKN